jgi:Asp-tRNA(Asn)/Glu-tRNA(Gln) amidotransferase A subunit family amidase
MGFKPSFGRVPIVPPPNAFAGATPLVAEGPITRMVEDAGLPRIAWLTYDPRTRSQSRRRRISFQLFAGRSRAGRSLTAKTSTCFRSIPRSAEQSTKPYNALATQGDLRGGPARPEKKPA